jgi:hypothetical protein
VYSIASVQFVFEVGTAGDMMAEFVVPTSALKLTNDGEVAQLAHSRLALTMRSMDAYLFA